MHIRRSPAPFLNPNSQHQYGMTRGRTSSHSSRSTLHLAKKSSDSKANRIKDQALAHDHLMGVESESRLDKQQQQQKHKKGDIFGDQAILSDAVVNTQSQTPAPHFSDHHQPSLEYLKVRLNVDDKDLLKMLHRSSAIPKWDIKIIEKHLSYLQGQLLLTDDELSKMIQKQPGVMVMDIEDNIAPSLDYLQQRLGLDDKELSMLIRRMPTLLGLNSQETLEPKIQYLESRLMLDKDGLRKIVTRSLVLLGLSRVDNIEPTLNWLEERLDLNQEQLTRIVLGAPTIISLSIPNKLQPTFEWFQERLHLKDDDALRTFILKNPRVCLTRTDTMSKKLDFYETLLGVDGARELMLEVPAMFTYSLEQRLMPRLQDVKEAGIAIDYGVVQRMGQYTGEKWDKGLVYQMKKVNRMRDARSIPATALALQ